MEDEARRLAAVRRVPGFEDRPVVIEPAIPVLASPSWRGVDGVPLVARDTETDATLFIKQIHPDTAFYIDVAAAFDAAEKAGALGVGPTVHVADVENGILVSEDLSAAGWRVAGLEKGYDAAFVDAVMEKRRAFAAAAPLKRVANVFEDVARLHAIVTEKGVTVPADTGWLVDMVGFAADAMGKGGFTETPIHGDGNISNILWKDGDVRLVDFDRAGNGDPLEDAGSFFVEAFAFEPEARIAFDRLFPNAGETAFNRLRFYGLADDLRWGLIAAIQASLSPRTVNEFYKYSNWRFVRARMGARDPRFGERIRRAG
ncbi:phosphotransferase family protein [Ensifer soli]|uniref:phosphotransferase family protein n=1 Tax=Ciceribacter sp. sgz301302 TaxID=3342379 RepID=UPI0035BA493D